MASKVNRRKKSVGDGIKLRGFARLQICDYGPNGEPNHKVVSDTGWLGPNQKTNIGFLNFLSYVLGASAGSQLVSFAAVGTGGTPASNAGSLTGETMVRMPTTYSAVGSTGVQWAASWASSDCTGSCTIGNAGLYAHSSQLSLGFGISTPGQTWNTNQSLNRSYVLNMS